MISIDGEKIVLTLQNGFTVRSAGDEFELGSYVRFCDENGTELLYWDSEEWREQPEEVMGAILGAMMHPERIVRVLSSAALAAMDEQENGRPGSLTN